MFFSSSSADLNVIIFLLFVALVISVVSFFVSKKPLVGFFVMSVLSNLILYLDSGSRLFVIYDIKWVVIFTLDFWPYVNVFLFAIIIFNYFKHRNEKNSKI